MTYRLGILADVHSDVAALDDALARLAALGCDEIVCAGDVVGYGYAPDGAIATLRANGVATVRGNHDRWLIERMIRGKSSFESDWLRAPESLTFLQNL